LHSTQSDSLIPPQSGGSFVIGVGSAGGGSANYRNQS